MHDDSAAIQSLDASNTVNRKSEIAAKGGTIEGVAGAPLSKAQNRRLMAGAPLLEAALSQKEFIIKKNKSKRGSSKGANYMKAYFPNLIAKKDVTLITPTGNGPARLHPGNSHTAHVNHAREGPVAKGGQNSNSAKQQRKFVQMSRSQHGSSNSTSGPVMGNYGQAHS